MHDATHPKVRSNDPRISVRELAGEVIIYDAQRKRVHSLNPTAAKVWRYCDGETSVDEMVGALSQQLEVQPQEARTLLLMTLERMEKAHLLDGWTADEWQIPTRRQALRAMAGVSMVALLPVIYSLLAPSAVQAQSGVVCGGPCHISQGQRCTDGCRCSKPHGSGVCIPA